MGKLKDGLARISAEKQSYTLETLPRSLAERSKGQRLHQLLTDFDFIEAKLELLGVQALIEDYDLARNSDVLLAQEQSQTLRLIQGAIRKSAHVLEKDKTQLPVHLWSRLVDFETPEIQGVVKQAKQSRNIPCLWPLKPNLERANEGALRTLADHSSEVIAVAIAPDGKIAISASYDSTLKIWDLLTGKEVASFSGEGAFDCFAFAPDGVTVVAGDRSGRVHFLRLEGMGDLGDAAGLNNPVSLFYSGLALAKQGQHEAALAKLTEVAEIRPDALIVCLEQGKVLFELGRYAEAVASLDQAKEIAGKDRDFWFCRGFALSKCDSQEAARESWDFAINIQPADCDFWFNKAKALFELERYEQTIFCLDLAINIEPTQSYLWDWRGIVLQKNGRDQEARSSYDRALELQHDDVDILHSRAYALLTLGRHEEAMANWDKALQIDPNCTDAYYNKACCFALQNQIELALENLQRAIELEPERCREVAKTDTDFDGIRGDVRFQELLGNGVNEN